MKKHSTLSPQKGVTDSDTLISIVVVCVFVFIIVFIGYPIYAGGIAFFFERQEASQEKLIETKQAQEELAVALVNTFNVLPRLEMNNDYSVHAYISKHDFDTIPYPDRDKAIIKIGRTWCNNQLISNNVILFLPHVYIQDIKSGDMLGSYYCFPFKL
jgi:hypothetical protein